MSSERSVQLVPLAEGGLQVEAEVLRSWTVKDAHGHVQAKGEVQGNLLQITMVGSELRVSKTQMAALMELGSRWQRYWDET